ncbi:hypothetical protein C9374_011891 [Naegleria lovaniensis]|uniref:USP8 dimerisation domain-containing protein n=1 Tax=Naegleria lovaniensis TaxID=51637 RepID=A0AA88GDJ3_NAELO|nr:uncharacterized protein C9374_011891 [Naegleria lovaniensis]KAG2373602.1 hypothetical protein C9374_011891 [Naegleria lovaniensis]
MSMSLLYSSLNDLNQAAIAQVMEVDDDTPLEIYFTTARNLLKEAKLCRESQDLEGMYKCLIQYLILVVKKLPSHKDLNVDEDQEESDEYIKCKQEYDYNFQKCDLVKQEIEKLRGQLNDLYDEQQKAKSKERMASLQDSDPLRRKSVIQPIVPSVAVNATTDKLPLPTSPSVLNKRFTMSMRSSNPNIICKTPTMIAQRSRDDPNRIVRVRLLPGIIAHEGTHTPTSVYHLVTPKQMQDNFEKYRPQPQQPLVRKTSKQPPPFPTSYQTPTNQQPSNMNYQQTPVYQQQQQQPTYQQQPPMYHSQQQQQYSSIYQQATPVVQYTPQSQTYSTSIYPQSYSQNTNYVESTYSNAVENVAYNERVQEYVGKQVGNLATNERVQKQVGSSISNAAKNQQVQSTIGNAIASSSDNSFVRSVATNQQVQSTVGSVIANTAGNEQVQKAVGNAIHRAANDKEMQKKVAKGFVSVAKGAFSATKAGANLGYQLYQENNKN